MGSQYQYDLVIVWRNVMGAKGHRSEKCVQRRARCEYKGEGRYLVDLSNARGSYQGKKYTRI